MKNKSFSEMFAAVSCNAVTFVVVFVVITCFAAGVHDAVWISARIIAAVAIAVLFAVKYPSMKAMHVFLRSLVQDLLAYIFRYQLAGLIGVSTSSPMWEFEYIGQVYVWITAIAIIQPVAIVIKRNIAGRQK